MDPTEPVLALMVLPSVAVGGEQMVIINHPENCISAALPGLGRGSLSS